jgi:hypothetical protein
MDGFGNLWSRTLELHRQRRSCIVAVHVQDTIFAVPATAHAAPLTSERTRLALAAKACRDGRRRRVRLLQERHLNCRHIALGVVDGPDSWVPRLAKRAMFVPTTFLTLHKSTLLPSSLKTSSKESMGKVPFTSRSW